MSNWSVSSPEGLPVLIVAIGLVVVAAAAAAVAFRERKGRENLELELNKLAHHDRLTGLPNRSVLDAWATDCLASSRRHSARAAIMIIDLDRFKHVNDTYGPQ